jgi:PAS domain-containing protein
MRSSAIDEDSRVQDWNPAAERLFGWSPEEIIGKTLVETISVPALSEASGYAFSAFVRDLSERREAELGSARERVESFSLPSGFWEGSSDS